MHKNILKVITLMLLVLCLSLFILTACQGGNEGKAVSSIQIIQGSFKENYLLDESLKLENAKILVTYVDGSTANVAITMDMVSGFDTSKTTTSGVLTVTYKGAKVNFSYTVTNSISIETSFRYHLAHLESEQAKGYDLSVKAHKASTVVDGVYAMRFTLSTTGGMTISDFALQNTEKYGMQTYSVSVTSAVVVVYSLNGYETVEDNETIITFKATKPSGTGTINIQNASISNGTTDFVVPATTYTFGG